MMCRLLGLTAASLMSILVSIAPVKADEPISPSGFELAAGTPADSSKDVPADPNGARVSKAAFVNATPAVRVAPCGVEADAGNSNLDAGLIDFNVPDPARAAGRSYDDQRDAGRNVGDYRSTVVLGVTLGYHF